MKGAPTWKQLREQWPYLRARVGQFIHRAEVIRRELMPRYDPQRVVVYAYWTHDWATVLGVVRERDERLRYFSRAHGFDIYEHDPQSQVAVSSAGFHRLGQAVTGLGLPTVYVQEGGYHLDALAHNTEQFFSGVLQRPAP